MKRDGSLERRFFIQNNYGGCQNDAGWFLVVEKDTCAWEQRTTRPYFLYSGLTGRDLQDNMVIADLFLISVVMDNCFPNPCKNSGTCYDEGMDYTCTCTGDWLGQRCTDKNGAWGSWGSYGACSKTCGTGKKTRTRTCDNPAPIGNGAACPGSSSEDADCNTQPCPIDGMWADWGSWGTCSTTCGGGNQNRTRNCTNPEPQYGGADCVGNAQDTPQTCNTNPCPIDGEWATWGAWGDCSVTCGGGSQWRNRTCTNPAPQYGGSPCSGSSSHTASCNTHACPIHGNWGAWGSYGSCSKTCASGTMVRSRSCNNPAPAYGGNNCAGSSTSSASCNTHNCPIHGNWGAWGSYGSCSKTCASGTMVRSRSCNNPAPAYGGNNCAGSSTSSASCNTHNCPIHGNWGAWGSYGSCSKTCASGTMVRSRSCNNPAPAYGGNNCAGSSTSSASCNTHNCPIHGNWASWSSWGSCTVTCGGGTKDRSRTCTNPAPQYLGNDCVGSGADRTDCNTHHCPIDGNWVAWTTWTACTVTCGGGTKDRKRTCTNPAPQYLGKDCVGVPDDRTDCNTHHCPIDGNWVAWTTWTACTVTCGGGTKDRERTCTNPAPQYLGKDCVGVPNDRTDCNTHHCPIDGNWVAWTTWTACTVTCGGGTKDRERTCTNPAPQYLGKNCTGVPDDRTDCNTHHCPIDGVWASWGNWGTCTETCGGGVQSRSRTCTNPPPQYGGANCPDFSSSTQRCNTHNCPIDGVWANWGNWGTCTVTCGGGRQDRKRTCTNPAPQYGGAACPGSPDSSQDCNTQPCPIDGNWATWGSWKTCSVTCGGGIQHRDRTCTSPAPAHGGAPCAGNSTSSQDCNTQICIIDGAWTDWSQWGSCTKTCGGGRRSRSRTCDNPKPANGGKECFGDSGDFGDCNVDDCPTVAAGTYQQLCPTGYFTCKSGAMSCIQTAFQCDCSADCDDGSDESSDYAGCTNTLECLQGGGGINLASTLLMAMSLLISLILMV
ncbi:SCO-spondin-like [Crassostrea virginica]